MKREFPKGLRVNKGYVECRLMHDGMLFTESFGPASSDAIKDAIVWLNDRRKDIRYGKLNLTPELPRLRFSEARAIFFEKHYLNWKDPKTNAPRSAKSLAAAKYKMGFLGRTFDKQWFDAITTADINDYKATRLKSVAESVFNKDRMFLYSMYAEFERWIAIQEIKPIKMPLKNPVALVATMTENERTRVPSKQELAEVYLWCQSNDKPLWGAIENAIITALRKGDLIGLDGKLTLKGRQQKTGQEFDLGSLTLEMPTGIPGLQHHWNKLREKFGWMKGNPKHTTWHDLRHWAATFLAEQGTPLKLIQKYTGHKTAAMLDRYINVNKSVLGPLQDAVKAQLDHIKGIKKEL